MDLLKKLKYIQQHFDNITEEEFEAKLMKAGFEEIEHSNQSQMKIEEPDQVLYSLEKNNYQFEDLPDTTTTIVEVA